MNKVLLDTDILSEIVKGTDPKAVGNAAAYRSAFGRYTIFVMSIMEVARGFQQKQSTRLMRLVHIHMSTIAPFKHVRVPFDFSRTPGANHTPAMTVIFVGLLFTRSIDT